MTLSTTVSLLLPLFLSLIVVSHADDVSLVRVTPQLGSSPAHGPWTFGHAALEGVARAQGTHTASAPLVPGSPAPPLSVPTLTGTFTFNASGADAGTAMLAMVWQPRDAFSSCMWSPANNASIDDFLLESPNTTVYLFMSYAADDATVRGNAEYLRTRLMDRAAAIGLSPAAVTSWRARAHFAVVPVQSLSGTLSSWLLPLLATWQSPLDQVVVTAPGTRVVRPRLDSQYAWLPWPTYANKTIIDAGDGCASFPAAADGAVVLVDYDLTAPACGSYFDLISKAAAVKATAIVLALGKGQPFMDMNCNGAAQCNTALDVSASVVDYETGVLIRQVLAAGAAPVNISAVNNLTSGFYFGVDHRGQLVQVGWEKYPWLRILSWEAQWLEYTQELYANLTRPALTVPVFGPSEMHGSPGVVVNVTLPPMQQLSTYEHMELDMALSCPGTVDETCAIWDHTVQLFVCCDGQPKNGSLCNQELGRWISPFRRRIGRWLTPVRSFLPLLAPPAGQAQATCQFTMKTVPWAMPWVPSLSIRFVNPQPPTALVPTQFTPLFRGGTFDSTYNNRTPIVFSTPTNARRVELVAVITGHGDDNNGCGEFCITSHHFVVNGKPHVIKFHYAGTPLGCADRVRTGVEPNEHGTWVYGRDGWCDGREVKPWVWDVTDDLLPAGQNNTVEYFGWFQGKTPDPTTSGAYIIMYSHLAFYTEA